MPLFGLIDAGRPYKYENGYHHHSKYFSPDGLGKYYAVKTRTQTSSDVPVSIGAGDTFSKKLSAHASDQEKLLSDVPGGRYSQSKSARWYHADPFGYAPKGKSSTQATFEQHKNLTAKLFPGIATANRVDMIDEARLIGRKTIAAIEAGNSDANIISVGSQVTGTAVAAATHTHGVVGYLAAGNVAGAIGAAPVAAAIAAINHGIQMYAKVRRINRAQSNLLNLSFEWVGNKFAAEAERDLYLDNLEKATKGDWKIKNISKNLKDVWTHNDNNMPHLKVGWVALAA